MAVVEVQEVTEALQGLGIATVTEEIEIDEEIPVVSWEGDLEGFLEAAKDLGPKDAYVGTLRIDEDLVESLQEEDDPNDPALEPFRKIIEHARALSGTDAGTQAIFVADGMMHEFYSLTPEASELFDRLEQYVEVLHEDHDHGACGCGHEPLLQIEGLSAQ